MEQSDQDFGNIEDLLTPPKPYAIKFHEQDENRGTYILLLHTEGIGLREGIFIVEEKDISILDRAGIRYEKYEPKSNDVDEVYAHWGIQRPEEKSSLFERVLKYLHLR